MPMRDVMLLEHVLVVIMNTKYYGRFIFTHNNRLDNIGYRRLDLIRKLALTASRGALEASRGGT